MTFASKLFIDGGDPAETKQADEILKKVGPSGIDGQTTNPTLIAKYAAAKKGEGQTLTMPEAIEFYKETAKEIAKVTSGPVSIQVLGDPATLTAEEMLSQARDRIQWIPNGVIKFPCTKEGLEAASVFCEEGPVNITLVFSQEQAAAVFAATKSHNYDVFVSPFVGRLDDRKEKGMDVVANIVEMYKKLGDGHVQVLTASTRTVEHIQYALWLKSDCITIPFKLFKQWADAGFILPSTNYIYDVPGLSEIPYREMPLDKEWTEYDISHELTTTGLAKFWQDWTSVVKV